MITSLDAIQEWLNHNACFRYPLDDLSKIINKNNLLKNKSKVIIVGGTNGKGTTIACIEAALLASGHTVATFTSPHLITLNERCRLNGKAWPEQAFIEAFNRVVDMAEGYQVSWFGYITLVFLQLCQTHTVDYWLVEVGIGGRGCPTNLIGPDIAAITTIDLDHREHLGDSREAIASEKAAIFRKDKPAICGDPNPPQSLLEYASKINANLLIQKKDFRYKVDGKSWCWQSDQRSFTHLPIPNIPLQNASTALAVLQFCQVSDAVISAVFEDLKLSGRMQVLSRSPMIICDVAHNPQACGYLAKQLRQSQFDHTSAIVSLRANKDIQACLQPMLDIIDHWYLWALPTEEGFLIQMKAILHEHHKDYTVCDSAIDAYNRARAKAGDNDRITIFGSFQLIGKILQYDAESQS